MRKTQNPRNILYLVLSIVIAAGIWYYVDEFNGRVVTQTVTGIPMWVWCSSPSSCSTICLSSKTAWWDR